MKEGKKERKQSIRNIEAILRARVLKEATMKMTSRWQKCCS
jgi:hypothetical protein